jgi:hypothetical protein
MNRFFPVFYGPMSLTGPVSKLQFSSVPNLVVFAFFPRFFNATLFLATVFFLSFFPNFSNLKAALILAVILPFV